MMRLDGPPRLLARHDEVARESVGGEFNGGAVLGHTHLSARRPEVGFHPGSVGHQPAVGGDLYDRWMAATLFLDRRVPRGVLSQFLPGGAFRPLVDLALEDRQVRDVQLRRQSWSSPERGESYVSVYAGLSAVVSVNFNGRGVKVVTHGTYQGLDSFVPEWTKRQAVDRLASQIDQIVAFTRDTIAHVTMSGQFLNEGLVHAALAAAPAESEIRTPNREVSISFKSTAARQQWMEPVISRYQTCLAALADPPPWWPSLTSLGTGCDFLAVDDDGRLLALEAKPANAATGIAKGPVQVALYAELLRAWVDDIVDHIEIVEDMFDQRVQLGLAPPGLLVVPSPTVVPVLAIGEGTASTEAMKRAFSVASALVPARRLGVAPLEIWTLDSAGCAASKEIIG